MVRAITVWASYFGDRELTLKAILKSSDERVLFTAMIWRPIHREMRSLPGFKDLVRDHGQVDYWRSTGRLGDFCKPTGEDDYECCGVLKIFFRPAVTLCHGLVDHADPNS